MLADVVRALAHRGETRNQGPPFPSISLADYAAGFSFDGSQYWVQQTYKPSNKEPIPTDFAGYASRGMQGNGPVFSLIDKRQKLFSQVKFAFEDVRDNRIFTSAALAPLEQPGPNFTRGELLCRMEQDSTLAGNMYAVERARGDGIRRVRPDFMTILIGSDEDVATDEELSEADAEILAYVYRPGGMWSRRKPVIYLPDEVIHYSPIPDPLAIFRGMSWLTPVLREIEGDTAATEHKLAFFRNGATPNMVVRFDPTIVKTPEDAKLFMEVMNAAHSGVANSFKTLYLSAAADAKVVGSNLKELDFKLTQGAGESRLASASGVPAAIAQFSEGLSGSTLNEGNFEASKRLFSDLTMEQLWQVAADSLAQLVDVPPNARLIPDRRNIPFLAEDMKDQAEVLNTKASALNSLLTAGYTPDAALQAVTTGDLTKLAGQHSGLYSVQLQKPGAEVPQPAPAA